MWTPETRAQHDRRGLRYSHDLTDQEWALVAPLIPPAKRGGNKRTVDVREIVNGLLYILGGRSSSGLLIHSGPPNLMMVAASKLAAKMTTQGLTVTRD